MPLIHEPVSRCLGADLRAAVLQHRLGETRRRFPAAVHLGRPGRGEVVFTDVPGHEQDAGLRRDVIAEMLRRADRTDDPVLWVTRPGELDLEDVDASWLSAAWAAHEEAGLSLTMVVVTRQGWRDPRTGVRRVWRRLRDRSG